jgi:leucyl/phenylalanyl-tRNA--protein transferase
LFPMAETRRGERLYWLDPEVRGVLPLDRFHLSRRMLRTVMSDEYEVAVDRDFSAVIGSCASSSPGREDTWINGEIERLFNELHRMGHAHSVETRQGGKLVGGLYGMFSRVRDASKVALVHLVARLRLGGYGLLDTQFVTTHLSQFGAMEIARDDYKALLAGAVDMRARWLLDLPPDVLAREFNLIAGRAVDAT